MNYQSTVTVNSKTFPGVRFTLRKWSVNRRREYNMAIAGMLARLRDIQDEQELLVEELRAAINRSKIAPCLCSHSPEGHSKETGQCTVRDCDCRRPDFPRDKQRRSETLLMDTLRIRVEEMQPAVLRWGLVSVDGLEIDGAAATVESLIESGPDDLVREIADELDELLGLRGESAKNSESPTTSGAPADGAMKNSGAPSAGSGGSTSSGTAASISIAA